MIDGCVSNCWRVQLIQGESLATILERALASEWRYIELRQGCLGECESGNPPTPDAAALGRFAALLPELRLSVAIAWPAFGTPDAADRKLFDDALDAAVAAAGAFRPLLRLVDLVTSPATAEANARAGLVDDWTRLVERAENRGAALAIENAGQSWSVLRDALRATRANLGARADNFRFCFDAVNLLKAADRPDPTAALRSLRADELAMVHFKQSRCGLALPEVTSGDIDWSDQGAALAAIGYRGPGLLEIDSGHDVWNHLHGSRKYLKNLSSVFAADSIAPFKRAVLLDFVDLALAERWRHWLADAGIRARIATAEFSAGERLDAVVRQGGVGRGKLFATGMPPDRARPGTAWVGDDPSLAPSDVDLVLSASAGPREVVSGLRLLCETAAQRHSAKRSAKAQKSLTRLALTDPLTQLPNRRAWQREVARRWKLAAQDGSPLCLAIIDLDRFKAVNDEFGRLAGDACLKSAAAALQRHTREEDFLARLGGDEFGVLLGGFKSEANVVELLRASVSAVASVEPSMSASAGFAIFQGEAEVNATTLFCAADEALRSAKRSGLGSVAGAQVAGQVGLP